MLNYSFVLPSYFDDYQGEVMAKGCFSDALMIIGGKQYRLNFYDPLRLGQDIAMVLENEKMFFEPNLVIVREVTRKEMERAAERLAHPGFATSLVPELP
ncbi:MAG: hypothetical protein ACK5RJ_13350 [Burkholderiales bacterium]|jgi:hypothetical protein